MTPSARAHHRGRVRATSRLALAVALTVSACGSDDDPPGNEVSATEAYVAIVRWEIEQHPAAADGDVELPVIYLRSESGGTVDIGVQADVVEATADDVVVRFSDEDDDSINADVDGQPVKDDGVLFVIGDLPEGGPAYEVTVRRYESIDRDRRLQMVITASDDGAEVTETTELS